MQMFCILALLFLLSSCNQPGEPQGQPLKQNFAYPAADSAWLDPEVQLYVEKRAVSPEGIDIRSAAYQLNGENLQFAILLRNYDARLKDVPDNQWVVQADVFSDRSDSAPLPDDTLPIRLLPGNLHQDVLLQTVKLDELGQVRDQTTSLQLLSGNGELTEVPGSQDLYPVASLPGNTIECWRTTALQLDRGLLHSVRDHSAGSLLLSQDGTTSAPDSFWLAIKPDPVSPSRSSISYYLDIPDNELPEDLEWQFPYHMSYSSESWLPPLFSLSDGSLVSLLFLPDAKGKSARANHNGIFRLARLDPADGSIGIIHEDLPPKLTILTQDDMLFYCLPADGSDGPVWEIWASDASGLSKRRLYDSEDSIYLNLADITGGRLLFFRQFFAREDASPVLFSELVEVSTEGLGRGVARLEKRLGGSADASDSGIPPISF